MTPQAQVPPAQPGWFSKNWKWLAVGGCLSVSLCCGSFMLLASLGALGSLDPDGVRVDCGTPGPGGVDCELKRTSGDTACEACWDLEITCTNQAKMVGHACATLGAGEQTGTANMPVADFSNQDQCDAPAAGTVTNLSVVTRD